MNINCTGTKKQGGTFSYNSAEEITLNQMRSSACTMIRKLVQLMRTLDKMPEERTTLIKLNYYDLVTYAQKISEKEEVEITEQDSLLLEKYSKMLLSCVCETVEGQIIDEYDFAFSYSNFDSQEVSMNINCTETKKQGGTFSYNSVEEITRNQMRSSACTMIWKLVQLMRTLDKMPEEEEVEITGHDSLLLEKYLKAFLSCVCETIEGQIIDEYGFAFSYSNSDSQEVSMNINCAGTKKQRGSFSYNSASEIILCSACKNEPHMSHAMSNFDCKNLQIKEMLMKHEELIMKEFAEIRNQLAGLGGRASALEIEFQQMKTGGTGMHDGSDEQAKGVDDEDKGDHNGKERGDEEVEKGVGDGLGGVRQKEVTEEV